MGAWAGTREAECEIAWCMLVRMHVESCMWKHCAVPVVANSRSARVSVPQHTRAICALLHAACSWAYGIAR